MMYLPVGNWTCAFSLCSEQGHGHVPYSSWWMDVCAAVGYTVFSWWYAHLRYVSHPPLQAISHLQISCNAMGNHIRSVAHPVFSLDLFSAGRMTARIRYVTWSSYCQFHFICSTYILPTTRRNQHGQTLFHHGAWGDKSSLPSSTVFLLQHCL